MSLRHCGPKNLQRGIYTQDDPLRGGSLNCPPPAFFLRPPPHDIDLEYLRPPRFDIEAGSPIITRTSCLTSSQHPSERPTEPLTSIWVVSFIHSTLSAVCMVYSLGLYRLYYRVFRFEETRRVPPHMLFDSTDIQRWPRIVERMSGVWKLSRIGCGVLLPLSIALLQIEGVVDTVIARTSTITTAIFASAGLLSSGLYLFFAHELINNQNKTRWIEIAAVLWTMACNLTHGFEHSQASRHSYALKSVEFWTYLALPIASLIWAIITCVITVMCIAWTNNHNKAEETQVAFIGSAIFITFLLATSVIYLYKASAMVVRMD